MFKTLELPGALPPPLLAPYKGFALDPLGALSDSQTPPPIILPPAFLIMATALRGQVLGHLEPDRSQRIFSMLGQRKTNMLGQRRADKQTYVGPT